MTHTPTHMPSPAADYSAEAERLATLLAGRQAEGTLGEGFAAVANGLLAVAAAANPTSLPGPGPDAALIEYQQIKAEQAARIGFRDNLLYVTVVAIAGVLTVAHSTHGRGYLLLVPAVTWILGWTYLRNDQMISAIGRYVHSHPTLAMGWETEHPADRRRQSRQIIQLAVDLTTFCGSALVALTAFWLSPETPLLLLASAVEAFAAGLLAWQFTAYAGLTRKVP